MPAEASGRQRIRTRDSMRRRSGDLGFATGKVARGATSLEVSRADASSDRTLAAQGLASSLATAFCPQTSPATRFARLFVIFAAAHFLFDSAALDQFAKTADRFLNRFAVANVQLNHRNSLCLAFDKPFQLQGNRGAKLETGKSTLIRRPL